MGNVIGEKLEYNMRLENFGNIALVAGGMSDTFLPNNIELINFMIDLANEFESDVWPMVNADCDADYWIVIDEFAESRLREKEKEWRKENGEEVEVCV